MKHTMSYLMVLAGGLLVSAIIMYDLAQPARWDATIINTSALEPVYHPGDELLGGTATIADTGVSAYGRSLKNMLKEHWPDFYQGKVPFLREWDVMPRRGRSPLGPLFNALSCDRCHERDGRGQPPYKPEELSESLVFHLSVAGNDGPSAPDPVYGDQLQIYGIDGTAGEGIVEVRYDEISGEYADGGTYTLMKPEYRFKNLAYGPLHPDIRYSPRIAPVNYGLGLLESIPEDAILANADPDDRNQDGISGRPNRVEEIRSGHMMLGRFGWKANQPTIEQQIARAFSADLGITSSLYPESGAVLRHAGMSAPGNSELGEEDFRTVISYIRLLGVPRQRNWDNPVVERGRMLFLRAGCDRCHSTKFQTGPQAAFPELALQTIHPYTDLLLHDMGEGLADGRPDGLAGGREWRTPPLWGIGLVKIVSGHTRFLHDGRARNIEEAILWHGGEGAMAQELYRRLKKDDRAALLAFLESL